jgi:hypothetical protein
MNAPWNEVSVYLSDATIRAELLNRLKRNVCDPEHIVEELRIHDGNAIADVVACNLKMMHCYEIKSDLDKIERVIAQAAYFNLAFPKLTLVTTEKHLAKAEELTPSFWGIMLASPKKRRVVLKSVRKHSHNPAFSKYKALKSLWKNELFDLLSHVEIPKKKLNRSQMAKEISNKMTKQSINIAISEKIRTRKRTPIESPTCMSDAR